MGREIRDLIGVIVKKFTETEGNLTRIFIIGENVTGTCYSTTISQTGNESTISLTFQVQ
jgi:homoserine acetyltransferase